MGEGEGCAGRPRPRAPRLLSREEERVAARPRDVERSRDDEARSSLAVVAAGKVRLLGARSPPSASHPLAHPTVVPSGTSSVPQTLISFYSPPPPRPLPGPATSPHPQTFPRSSFSQLPGSPSYANQGHQLAPWFLPLGSLGPRPPPYTPDQPPGPTKFSTGPAHLPKPSSHSTPPLPHPIGHASHPLLYRASSLFSVLSLARRLRSDAFTSSSCGGKQGPPRSRTGRRPPRRPLPASAPSPP